MKEIKFKVTKKESSSCEGYRSIQKFGDTQYDLLASSDDVINLFTVDGKRIGIDCDHKTGIFRLFFDGKAFKLY